jgi:hypothetical protein
LFLLLAIEGMRGWELAFSFPPPCHHAWPFNQNTHANTQTHKTQRARVQITGDGEVVDFLHDPTGARVAYVSAASEAGGRLYLGNLVQDYVSVLDL